MEKVLLAILLVIVLVVLFVVLVLRCSCRSAYTAHEANKKEGIVASGAKKLGFHENTHEGTHKKMQNYYVMRHGVLTTPLFKWSDHPWLVKEAANQGWTCFGFNIVAWPPSLKWLEEGSKPVLPLEGSECMQKIVLSGEMKGNCNGVCLAMAMLPLPGPKLASSIFPQQAYFEIILSHEGGGGEVMVSVGLTSSRTPPCQLPGSYPGSIGYFSDGSVHLDGLKLVKETKQDEEVMVRDRVIGCGFDPRKKKVIFTENSQLVHEISCKLEDFGCPMYPLLSTTGEVQVTVNFGQCPFKYEDANVQRTPEPHLVQPLQVSASSRGSLVYEEESKELFSIGRVDSQFSFWSKSGYEENWTLDSDDLFEIVLDPTTITPSTDHKT